MSKENLHPMDDLGPALRRAQALSEVLAVHASADSYGGLEISDEALANYGWALDDYLSTACYAYDRILEEDCKRRERDRKAAEAPRPDPSGHIAAIDDLLLRMRSIAHAACFRKEKLGDLILDDLTALSPHWHAVRNGGTDHG